MHAFWKVSLVIIVNVMLLSMISILLQSFTMHEEEVFPIMYTPIKGTFYVLCFRLPRSNCCLYRNTESSQLPRSCTMRSPHVGATVIQILLLPVALTSIIMGKHGFSRHFVDQPYWYSYKITLLEIFDQLFTP